ncbi:MAG: Ig-like domain-containing protein [Flavobacteriales bacterium]
MRTRLFLTKGAEPKRSNGLSVKNDWVTTTVNTPIRIHPLDNDRHESGAEISISKVERASVGTAVIDDNDVLYIPPKGFEGYDKFTYSAMANGQESPMATVIISIVPEKKFLEGTGIVNGSASARSGEEISIDLKAIAQLGTNGVITKVGNSQWIHQQISTRIGVVKYQSKVKLCWAGCFYSIVILYKM